MKLEKQCLDVGLVTADIEAALTFYVDLLGFQKVAENPIPGRRILHELAVGDSVLKLQELQDVVPPEGARGLTQQRGIRYITLWVHDLHEVVALMEKRGVTFIRRLEATPRGFTMAMLEDPDGNVVELMGRTTNTND